MQTARCQSNISSRCTHGTTLLRCSISRRVVTSQSCYQQYIYAGVNSKGAANATTTSRLEARVLSMNTPSGGHICMHSGVHDEHQLCSLNGGLSDGLTPEYLNCHTAGLGSRHVRRAARSGTYRMPNNVQHTASSHAADCRVPQPTAAYHLFFLWKRNTFPVRPRPAVLGYTPRQQRSSLRDANAHMGKRGAALLTASPTPTTT